MSLIDIAPLPEVAFISSVESAAVPPVTPLIVIAPVPEVISKSVLPLTVELKVTAPRVSPVFRLTAPVPIVSASEIVMAPPSPAVPELVPPEVFIDVS